jgi:hypothetical protein
MKTKAHAGMGRVNYWLWGLAERKDMAGAFPRIFWRWLLRRQDRKAGYRFGHDA